MHLFLLIGLVAFSILAILLRDLLKAAISLAVASIFLSVIFFRLNAPYAGVFEISVVAGLITVLFVATIALTRSEGDVRESKLPMILFPFFFVAFISIIINILIVRHLIQIPTVSIPPVSGSFGEILWRQRTFDIIGQIGVIFAGVFSVLALFRSRGRNG